MYTIQVFNIEFTPLQLILLGPAYWPHPHDPHLTTSTLLALKRKKLQHPSKYFFENQKVSPPYFGGQLEEVTQNCLIKISESKISCRKK